MEAILVAVKLRENDNFDDTIVECHNLCEAAGITIVDTMIQASSSLEPNTALRSGKLEELKALIEEKEVQQVVFYNNLSVNVVSNLKDILGIEVIDRTSLILMIFSMRARSKEAQIQTEIARLKYNIPQLLKANMDQDKQRGGTVNNRGAGETRSDIIRRNMESRISDLNKELKKLETRKEIEYQKRNLTGLKKVALVGYTNAGKSSLMNVLLERNGKQDKKVLQKDQLFATLDTSLRNIQYNKHEFLLYDTVGFVSDLPHSLVKAFQSTLKAVSYADLLIHVIDGSNPNYLHQHQVTMDTLKQINADHIPMISVYNKCDLIENHSQEGLFISCTENIGIDQLLDQLIDLLYPKEEKAELLVPYDKLYCISQFEKYAEFIHLADEENGSLYEVSCSSDTLNQIQKAID